MTTLLLATLVAGATPKAPATGFTAAWLRDGRVEIRATPGASAPAITPLGSTWKLFVFAYTAERSLDTPVYRCGLPRKAGEEYCCEPGGSIDRDRALEKSCGLFFDPLRLHIDRASWRAFWAPRVRANAAWLADLGNLKPETEVSVAAMLEALAAVPPSARAAACRALLPVVIDGYGRGVVAHVGGMLRVKTFTWKDPRHSTSLGGGAGWLVDGTPIWFSSTGSSRSVLLEHAATLAGWLPAPQAGPDDDPCVEVAYFERYPIHAIDAMPARVPAPEGPLAGIYRILFDNGNTLVFKSAGELALIRERGRSTIRGRLPLSEYVARVLDREADPTIGEAARALAVVARTWTLRHAPYAHGCYQVADSTRMQRVSASRSTPAARAASLFTDGLVLDVADARYHRDAAAPGVLGWTAAVVQANSGRSFDDILARAFPRASLATMSGQRECRRLAEADAWLARTEPAWRLRLAPRPGFEPPDALAVCALEEGAPYADRARMRIYVRGVTTQEDRISIAHEYVHLAFRFYPGSSNEAFVEDVARSLVQQTEVRR